MKDILLTVRNEGVTREGICRQNFMCQQKKTEVFRSYSSMQDSS